MENENKVESNIEVIDAKEQKSNKNILGKIIGWLIVLAIFGGIGYLIYQNGGIPEDGLDIGEIIGYNCPDDMYLAGEENKPVVPSEKPEDYEVVRKLISIENSARQKFQAGFRILYHIDSNYEPTQSDEHKEIISQFTGITDFSDIIGVSDSTRLFENGVYITLLIEYEDGVDTEQIKNEIVSNFDLTNIDFGAEEFRKYCASLTTEDLSVASKNNYVYIVIISKELIENRTSINPEKLIQSFYNTIY